MRLVARADEISLTEGLLFERRVFILCFPQRPERRHGCLHRKTAQALRVNSASKAGEIMAEDIFITAAARTAMGSFQGALRDLTAPEIGGTAIAAVVEQQDVDKTLIDEVIMGCVLPAGLGQAPARQASFAGGLSESVPCTTVNKMCGSGMKAVMLGYDQIKAGGADIIIAGGMESMSNAPICLQRRAPAHVSGIKIWLITCF